MEKDCQRIYLPKDSKLELEHRNDKLLGINEIHTKGYRLKELEDDTVLYTSEGNWEYEPVDLTYIPYYA